MDYLWSSSCNLPAQLAGARAGHRGARAEDQGLDRRDESVSIYGHDYAVLDASDQLVPRASRLEVREGHWLTSPSYFTSTTSRVDI